MDTPEKNIPAPVPVPSDIPDPSEMETADELESLPIELVSDADPSDPPAPDADSPDLEDELNTSDIDAIPQEEAVAEDKQDNNSADASASSAINSRKKALEKNIAAARERRERERLERLTNTDSLSVNWSNLAAAFKANAVLQGKVSATFRYRTKDPDTGKRYDSIGLAVYFGGLRILVPMELFYNSFPVRNMRDYNLGTEAGRKALFNRLNQFANNLLGANIQFCVVAMTGTPSYDTGKYQIVASRAAAMKKEIAANYNKDVPLYKEGDFVTADIIRVGLSTMTVNIGGLDCTMDRNFITCRYCAVLKDMYKPGDKIDVQIINERRSQNGDVRIIVSGVSAELNQSLLRNYAGLKVKDTIIVRVSDIRETRSDARTDSKELVNVSIDTASLNTKLPNKVHFIAWSEDLNVPVIIHDMTPYFNGLLPSPGDLIRVNVNALAANGYVHAFFRANYGNPNNI